MQMRVRTWNKVESCTAERGEREGGAGGEREGEEDGGGEGDGGGEKRERIITRLLVDTLAK